jgi:Na+-driven multidrug efflux pump
MVAVTVFLQWKPEILVGFFTAESEATEIGATFLRTISWTFIAQGVVFTCSGMFQGLGNTRPAMLSSAVRLAVFVPLAVWLSTQPGFHLEQLWLVSVMTVWIQAGVSYMLLRQQFNRRLTDAPRAAAGPVPVAAAAENQG